jgi:WD40 repeat protein
MGEAAPTTGSRVAVRARVGGARLRALVERLLPRRPAAPAGEAYDAFISYSHRRDGRLAAALKQGLHAFARPWYRVRALHVFLDNANLAANPNLWDSIEEALGRARHLVLLASPEAAASPWVDREIRQWRATRPADRLVLALTAGELSWDPTARDFDWEHSDAAPRALSGAFGDEPRWIDLRPLREVEAPSLRDADFRTHLADVAAPLHNRTKEELIGEDVRQHRRTVRIVRGTVILLLALLAAAGVAAVIAVRQRDRAEEQLRIATSRFLSAEAAGAASQQHSQSLLLGVEAVDTSLTAEARAALYGALVRLPQAERYIQPRTGGPQSAALSPDGRTLAAGTTAGAVELWDARSGRHTRTIKLGSGTPITDVAFDPGGSTLAAIDPAGQIRLLDPATGKKRGDLPRFPQAERPSALELGPNGLLASGHLSGQVRLWDLRSGSELAGPAASHTGGVTDVALSPGGRLLAVGGQDGTVSVWRLGAEPRFETELVPGEGRASAVAFSPDGERLAASAQNGQVALWATTGWTSVGGGRHRGGEVPALAFTGDGSLLASGGFDNLVRLWDPATGEETGRPLGGHIAFVSDLAAAAEGHGLASAGADGNIVQWDPTRQDRLARLHPGTSGRTVGALTAEGGGRRLAWVEEDTRLVLSDGASTHRLLDADLGDEVRTAAFSPDGRLIAATTGATFDPSGDTLHVWRTAGRSRVGRPLRAPPFTRGLAFGPGGRVLYGETFDDGVVRWALDTGRRTGGRMRGVGIDLSDDGRLLAASKGAADDGTVLLWNPRTSGLEGRLHTGRPALVWDVDISPDGRTLAGGDNDGNLVLWDLAARRRLGEPLTGHGSRVEHLAFSPSGELLATSDSSGETMLWDVGARRPLGPGVPGWRPSFGADGRLLASALPAGGLAIRPLDLQRWRTLACAVANRNLGPREWEQFMAEDAPYEPTCPGRERGHPASVAVSAD